MNDRERMNAVKAMLARRTRSHTQTQEAAEAWLKEGGLLDQNGRLRPQFGGDGERGNNR